MSGKRPFYELASARVASFGEGKGWPHGTRHLANPETLAEAGFRFVPDDESDLAKCFTCNKGLSDWAPDDDPFLTHYKHNPKCAWALARCSVVLDKDKRGRYVFKDKARLPDARALVKARHETFRILPKIWPPDAVKGHGATSKRMAEAGFVYTPQERGDDTATCVYCDVSLSGWEATDDPFEEHRSRNSKCPIFSAEALEEIPEDPPKSKRATKAKASMAAPVEDEPSEPEPRSRSRKGKEKEVEEEPAPPKLRRTKSTILQTRNVDDAAEDEPAPAKSTSKKGKGKAAAPPPPSETEPDAEEEEQPAKQRSMRSTSRQPPPSASMRSLRSEASEPEPAETSRAAARGKAKSKTRQTQVPTEDDEAKPAPAKSSRGRKTKVVDDSEAEVEPAPAPKKSSRRTRAATEEEDEPPPAPAPARKTAARKTKTKAEVTESEVEAEPPAPAKKAARKTATRRTKAAAAEEDTDASQSQSQAPPGRSTRKKPAAAAESDSDAVASGSRPRDTVVALPTDSEAEALVNPKARATRKKSKAPPSSTAASTQEDSDVPQQQPKSLKRMQSARKLKEPPPPPTSDSDMEVDFEEQVEQLKKAANKTPRPADRSFKKTGLGKSTSSSALGKSTSSSALGKSTSSTALGKSTSSASLMDEMVVQTIPESDGAEPLGLLPVKKGPKKPKAAKKDATPPPEPSRFNSFADMEVDPDVREDDGGEGEDPDDAVPALPDATQALANLGIEMDLDLGYEDPFLSPSKRAGGMRLVRLDQDVVMSTPTKARPVPAAAADEATPVQKPRSKPKSQSKPESKPKSQPKPESKPKSKPASQPKPDSSKQKQEQEKENVGEQQQAKDEPPLVPEEASAPMPMPMPMTPERPMQMFVASPTGRIIPELTELSEAEQKLTVEQWIRLEMQRVCDAIRAEGQRELDEFMAHAARIRAAIEALPEA